MSLQLLFHVGGENKHRTDWKTPNQNQKGSVGEVRMDLQPFHGGGVTHTHRQFPVEIMPVGAELTL